MKSAQGDIIRILDDTGAVVVEYTYDTWGKIFSITGSQASTVGALNPYRYRSYRYDTETGLYYLNSRYYDPEVGRFINADGYAFPREQGILGNNMFSYCGNNPVNRADPNGMFWQEIGSFFKSVGTAISSFVKSTFGVEATTVHQVAPPPIQIILDPSPITVKTGKRTSTTTSSKGDSSKPIFVYAQGRSHNYLVSSPQPAN